MSESRASADCFLGASRDPTDAYAAIVGLAWDVAVTYRGGAEQGPTGIRAASDSIETYCPKLRLDLDDGTYADLGDLELPTDAGTVADTIDELCRRVASLPSIPLLGLGGDHLAAYPFMHRALTAHPDLHILHIDAHADLREDWEGEAFNHSTVLRRVLDLVGEEGRIHHWGIRSGLRSEFELMADDPRLEQIPNDRGAGVELARRLAASGRPLYVTLDVDGIDPADIPGTGTPEPDGLRFGDVEAALGELVRAPRAATTRLIGTDLVEVAPALDPSGRSTVAAARLVRTMLLMLRELR